MGKSEQIIKLLKKLGMIRLRPRKTCVRESSYREVKTQGFRDETNLCGCRGALSLKGFFFHSDSPPWQKNTPVTQRPTSAASDGAPLLPSGFYTRSSVLLFLPMYILNTRLNKLNVAITDCLCFRQPEGVHSSRCPTFCQDV